MSDETPGTAAASVHPDDAIAGPPAGGPAGEQQPRPFHVHRHARLRRRRFHPPRRDRDVTALEQLAQALPQLAFERRQLRWELQGRVEVAVVDGADLEPQPSALHGPLGRSIPRHAARHSLSS